MKGRHGLSLPEVILAVSLLGMVIAMILVLFPFSQRITASANHYWLAQDVMVSHMERTVGLDFDSIPASDVSVDTMDNIQFTCEVDAAAYGTDNPVMLKQITSTVRWDDGRAQTMQLTTLLVRTVH